MLRSLSTHFKNQNWMAVAIEFLIIVVGVFLGLQAQEWNQQRTDRIEEQAYMERLAEGFVAIDRDLRQCLSVYADSLDAINVVSQAFEDSGEYHTIVIANRDDFANALIRMTADTVPAGRSATYLEMLSTGDLSILRDTELRDALVAYDERAQTNRESWRSLREESIAYMQPLYAHVTLNVELDAQRVSSIPSFDENSIARDPGFHSMLNVLTAHKGNNYELCQYQLELVDKVQRSLLRHREAGR